jgi:ATPase family associated with various cellular activities (AAA)
MVQSENQGCGDDQRDLFSARLEAGDQIGARRKCVFRMVGDSTMGPIVRGRNSETITRVAGIRKSLRETGLERACIQPHALWRAMLNDLAQSMPNFSAVIHSVVRPHAQLVAAGVDHRMPPILLLGDPGVGKTRFARRLAQILGLPRPLQISMAAETNGSSLAGSSSFWSNAAPGLLFESIAWGTATGLATANPLVLLDELDKASGTADFDPIGALYTLLEADTAENFQDQALPDLYIDTSSVRWIATANDISAIPDPIRSRMCAFEIALPSADQQRAIAQSIYQGLLARYHLPLANELPPSVLDRVTALSPRETSLALDCAIACAVSRCSFEIDVQDLGQFASRSKPGIRSRIGFR